MNRMPAVAIDVCGENPRAQIVVYDAQDEPVAHLRLSVDLQRVLEVQVRSNVRVLRDSDSRTQWELERDADIPGANLCPPTAEALEEDKVFGHNGFWLVEINDKPEVVKLERNVHTQELHVLVPGSEQPLPLSAVETWVMEIGQF